MAEVDIEVETSAQVKSIHPSSSAGVEHLKSSEPVSSLRPEQRPSAGVIQPNNADSRTNLNVDGGTTGNRHRCKWGFQLCQEQHLHLQKWSPEKARMIKNQLRRSELDIVNPKVLSPHDQSVSALESNLDFILNHRYGLDRETKVHSQSNLRKSIESAMHGQVPCC